MPRHVMIDIETLSTAVDAPVLSVGVAFFTVDGRLAKSYYHRLHLHEQIVSGRVPSASTIRWWMRQSKEAQDAAFGPEGAFNKTVAEIYSDLSCLITKNDMVWARGPHFDIAILGHLFAQQGLPEPWYYGRVRDSRTLLDSLPFLVYPENTGTPHHALHDAEYEADRVILALQFLRQFEKMTVAETKAA